MKFIKYIPGFLFSSVIALIAIEISIRYPLLSKNGFSILTLAIFLGILIGNLPTYKFLIPHCLSGVNFSKQTVLRLGIILYGFRLTFQDISVVGINGIIIDSLTLISTFILSVYFGMKYFGLDRDTSVLIGAGNSICGAAAILATQPILKASNERVTIAISTIVIFGTLAIFVYPIIYSYAIFNSFIEISPSIYGIYIGSTVHEVAQVVATANSIGDEVTNTAVIAKMVRVIMLGPFLISLSVYLSFSDRVKRNSSLGKLANERSFTLISSHLPWFAILFLLAIAFNSSGLVSELAQSNLVILDNFLLALAMAALGLTTDISSIAKAGLKPLKLALLLFVWLVIGGSIINIGVTRLIVQLNG